MKRFEILFVRLMIIILIVVKSQNRFFAPFLFTSTHVSAFHNFSELKCVFFLFMIVGINSNSCRKMKGTWTKDEKYRNWMGEQYKRERKYGVSYTILWLLQTESTRKTVRDSQLLTWREKVYLYGLSILYLFLTILKVLFYYDNNS